MATRIESHVEPRRLGAARRSHAGALIALVLAASAAAGAWWLSEANHAHPWTEAFDTLTTSGKACLDEGDAAAHAAARVARSQTQLESFVRHRFDQFRAQADQAEAEWARTAARRTAAHPVNPTPSEGARLELRLAALKSQRVELLERLMPEHPAVIDVTQQIVALEYQLVALGSQAQPVADPTPEIETAQNGPVAGWKGLVEKTSADYQQLAAACRRAERDLDDAQVGESTALDRHISALQRIEETAADWDHLAAVVAGITWLLWFVAGAAIAVLSGIAGRAAFESLGRGAGRVITSARQIESWFSLPVVGLNAPGFSSTDPSDQDSAASSAGGMPRWLVFPAQLAMAVAVFLIVVVTIQNPAWPQQVASDPWHSIGQLWGR